jgi:AraC family transcriptional regulator
MPHSPPPSPVFEVLPRTNADLEREALLGDGFRAALWRREWLQDVIYDQPEHHTLSFYLEDGFDVFLQGQPAQRGAPGKLCLLPAGHHSHWHINGRIRFLHFYFTRQQFDQLALRMLDQEPRTLELYQRIYMSDPILAQACRHLTQLDWRDANARLDANAIGHELMAYLLLNQTGKRQAPRVRGGLSPAQRRRALERIDDGLASELTIGMLADELALSEFHFARMFRASVGEAPHRWIMRRRLDRARSLLAQGQLPLETVAAESGFSHASHLIRRLRAELGIAPGAYRKWACERQNLYNLVETVNKV